jgi:hypothetical protein
MLMYISTNAIGTPCGSHAGTAKGGTFRAEGRLSRPVYALAAAGIVVLFLASAYLWRMRADVPAPSPPMATAPEAPAAAPALPPIAAHYPVDTKAADEPPRGAFDLRKALDNLLGSNTVESLVRLDDFPRRLAATIDNLGRSHAPPVLWPVSPAGGRFSVEERDGKTYIGPDNGLRYTPYVLLLETVDLREAVGIYVRIYPTLQRAYEELGYPRGYLNDRLVQVIDQLLATPEIDTPLEVRLPPIEGPIKPKRPWLLYEFVDPELQSLTSGQRLLLRTGAVNERRIKTRLAEIRRLVTAIHSRR